MSFLGSLANILTGGVAGGITGIIGSIASAFVNYKMKKMDYDHQIEMARINMEKMELETNLKIRLAEAKVKGEVDIAEMEALKDSYKDLSKKYFSVSYFDSLPSWSRPLVALLFAFLDFIRGIIRPLATTFITVIVSWIGYSTYQSDPTAFVSSAPLLVSIILYITVMIYAWWFCDRKIEKFLMKKGGQNE